MPKYVNDYSTLLTGGLTGNLAVTYLGSYALHYNVLSVDNGYATVTFDAYNVSNIGSATHPPWIGYTPLWNQWVATPLNNAFQNGLFGTGIMQPTMQYFNWTELLQMPNHTP